MRLVTINTWKGDGAYHQRLALLSSGLQALSPDIVCLQESLRTHDGCLDTARHLARQLGMIRTWVPLRLKDRLVDGQRRSCFSGMAILSRHPILQTCRISLPPHPEDLDRVAHWVDISAGPHRWRIVNLHLTHISGAHRLRQAQLAVILATARHDAQPDVVWLCGDFNGPAADLELRMLKHPVNGTVIDAYIAAKGPLPGTTFPVWPGHTEGRRIDRILMIAKAGACLPVCEQAATIFNEPDISGHYASDHAGVMVDIDAPAPCFAR
jgi:endonuclease/exonuclease/phosphatase family metal-dependent hydrolase